MSTYLKYYNIKFNTGVTKTKIEKQPNNETKNKIKIKKDIKLIYFCTTYRSSMDFMSDSGLMGVIRKRLAPLE